MQVHFRAEPLQLSRVKQVSGQKQSETVTSIWHIKKTVNTYRNKNQQFSTFLIIDRKMLKMLAKSKKPFGFKN